MARSLEAPLCIVGDVHLGRKPRPELENALADLVKRHRRHEFVLNGDTFDLSAEPPGVPADESLREILSRHPDVSRALTAHLAAGGRVSVVVGNHDAALARSDVQRAMAECLSAAGSPSLCFTPWFVRRGAVHVEHGHVYDPDNAPLHPLAEFDPDDEPLGVVLMRRFIAKRGVWEFAHGNETTPLDGLIRTFRAYGPKAPLLVLRYHALAMSIVYRAGASRARDQRRLAAARSVEAFAGRAGLPADTLRELAIGAARPTHLDALTTFQRLYLDRSLATLALGAALAGAGLGSAAGAGAAALAATYLGVSIARGTNRYGGLLERRLEDAARWVRDRAHAELVVFGHSHRRSSTAGYENPGSFAYPNGNERSYVIVERESAPEVRTLALR